MKHLLSILFLLVGFLSLLPIKSFSSDNLSSTPTVFQASSSETQAQRELRLRNEEYRKEKAEIEESKRKFDMCCCCCVACVCFPIVDTLSCPCNTLVATRCCSLCASNDLSECSCRTSRDQYIPSIMSNCCHQTNDCDIFNGARVPADMIGRSAMDTPLLTMIAIVSELLKKTQTYPAPSTAPIRPE